MKVRGGGAASFVADCCRFLQIHARSRAEWQEIPPANDNQMCCAELNVHQQARVRRPGLVSIVGVFFCLVPSLSPLQFTCSRGHVPPHLPLFLEPARCDPGGTVESTKAVRAASIHSLIRCNEIEAAVSQ